jgi:hypothetical protein
MVTYGDVWLRTCGYGFVKCGRHVGNKPGYNRLPIRPVPVKHPMYTYIYAYIYIYTHTHIHIHTHTHIHIYIYIYTYI